jgi:hypothetical protein
MPPRKAPTVPLYVRIPFDLRNRLDAAVSSPDRPWMVRRLQDVVIEALYAVFPAVPEPTPDAPTPAPAAPAPAAPPRAAKPATARTRKIRKRTTRAQHKTAIAAA